MEKQIEIYLKNSKALCDMLALSSYHFFDTKKIDISAYIILDEVIKDLEDKDVNIPLKSKSVNDLFLTFIKDYYDLLGFIQRNGYKSDLSKQLYNNYYFNMAQRCYAKEVTCSRHKNLETYPFDFIGQLCDYFPDAISEILCSNIEMAKKINILYDIIMHFAKQPYIQPLDYILDPKGAGYELTRTSWNVKEQKISELLGAFKNEMGQVSQAYKISDLFNLILKNNKGLCATNWLCYLQNKKIVDFMNLVGWAMLGDEQIEVTICVAQLYIEHFDLRELKNFEDFYQLEDYLTFSEDLRSNDSKYILSNISFLDLISFIELSNYEIRSEHIEIIGKRVLDYQKFDDEVRKDKIEKIKLAILKKAKNKEEYKTMCKYAQQFEQLADYEAYKKTGSELALRLFNMNKSLQEQVPEQTIIKNLVFEKKE